MLVMSTANMRGLKGVERSRTAQPAFFQSNCHNSFTHHRKKRKDHFASLLFKYCINLLQVEKQIIKKLKKKLKVKLSL